MSLLVIGKLDVVSNHREYPIVFILVILGNLGNDLVWVLHEKHSIFNAGDPVNLYLNTFHWKFCAVPIQRWDVPELQSFYFKQSPDSASPLYTPTSSGAVWDIHSCTTHHFSFHKWHWAVPAHRCPSTYPRKSLWTLSTAAWSKDKDTESCGCKFTRSTEAPGSFSIPY